jgi:hypothetical protein
MQIASGKIIQDRIYEDASYFARPNPHDGFNDEQIFKLFNA